MSTKWYPFIDKNKCTGCIACIEYCERGVLEERDKKAHVKVKRIIYYSILKFDEVHK